MEIKFSKVSLENFGSFNARQVLSLKALPIGLIYVKGDNRVEKRLGPNGAGKSTLMNAISWCLNGQTTSGLKASDIKPWKKLGKPRVEVTLEIDDKPHIIARTAPNFIELNGKETSQDAIDKLVRISHAVFKQTVLFGQREPLFFDLANRDKLALLSDVLELDRWEVRSQKASERTQALDRAEAELGVTLDLLESNLADYQLSLTEAIAARKAWDEELAKRLAVDQGEIVTLRADYKKVCTKLASATRIAKDAAEKVGAHQAEMQIAKTQLQALEKEAATGVAQAAVWRDQLAAHQRELSNLSKASKCPTCGQPIKKRADLSNHQLMVKDQIEFLKKKLAKIVDPTKGPNAARIKDKYIMSKSRVVMYQTELDAKNKICNQLSHKEIELRTKLNQLKQSATERKDTKNPYNEAVRKLKAQIQETKDVVTEAKREIELTNRRAERSRYWIKGFKDVRLFVIEDVLHELELTTNALLEEMGLLGWAVNYAVERETKRGTLQTGMTISILSPYNKQPVKWECWSGGESQRLRLAGAMALSEVLLNAAGISIDLEILDEPTKHLSAEGRSDMCEMLATRATQLKRKILYIDHTVVEGAQFASSITVQKTKEGSIIQTRAERM